MCESSTLTLAPLPDASVMEFVVLAFTGKKKILVETALAIFASGANVLVLIPGRLIVTADHAVRLLLICN